MPRKSPEALAGEWWRAQNAPPPPPPPEPPAWMAPAPATIWRQIVAERPPDYFDPPNQHLLAALCLHAARADLIAHEIEGLDPRDPQQFRRLARLSIVASRETRMLTMCLTKLRLLPSKAQAEAATAAAAASARAQPLPWERHT